MKSGGDNEKLAASIRKEIRREAESERIVFLMSQDSVSPREAPVTHQPR
jgi:hypothetical protein